MGNTFTLKNILRLFCLIMLFVFIQTVIANDQGKSMELKSKIQEIQDEVGDLTSPFDLYNSEVFMDIWQNPKIYVDNVLKLLTDIEVSEIHKEIAALSIQNLPLDDFIGFCETIIKLRTSNRISQHIFKLSIFPGYPWNTTIEENYNNPKVKRFLMDLKKSDLFPKKSNSTFDNRHIDKILSGKVAIHIKDMRSAGQIP